MGELAPLIRIHDAVACVGNSRVNPYDPYDAVPVRSGNLCLA